MRKRINQFFDRRRTTKRRSLFVVAGLLLLVVPCARVARAQQRNNNATNATSDLALQNLKRVAASAPEIKVVLTRDPGLMVELKRWVAKDATEHGQIVGESELSDYAIFDRLGTDVEFRSIATALLQKYGYLLPKLNPESDQAKEQELLRIERTKWMAQAQEEERTQARQKAAQELQKAAACQSEPNASCNQSLSTPPQGDNSGQGHPIETIPSGVTPPDQNIPNLPIGPDALQRAQLMQTGAGSSDTFSSSPFSQTSYLSSSSSSNSGNGSTNAVTWGAFPGKEIITPTIIEEVSFRAWAEEAFGIWGEWGRVYGPGEKGQVSRGLIEGIKSDVWLVNIIHHGYVEKEGLWSMLLD